VLDEVGFGTPTSTITAAAGKLVQQTISGATTATRVVTTSSLATTTKTISYYTVSRNTVTFSTTVRGWYIDYPAANSGQRNVYPLDLLAGRYVGIDSISPTNVTVSDPCAQSNTGAGWLYYVDGLTGGGPSEPILDTNGDGKIDSTDSLANGISTTADGRNTSVKDDALSSATQTTYANVSGGSADATLWSFSCTVLNNCVTNVKREWRQLFMR
jgi:type IV pilus assembly protein PilY1